MSILPDSPATTTSVVVAITNASRTLLHILRRDAFVLVWYVLLTLLVMAPVLRDPRHTIIGEYGDNIHYVYMVGWSAQALLMGESPFVDPRLNYPDDLALAANDSPYLFFLLVAPITWVLGPVAGYNLVIGLSYLLTGYFTYLWARRLTAHPLAALLAGTAFMLTPFRIIRSVGHANIIATQMIPLFFWALDTCVRQRDVRESRLWLLGAATFGLAGSSQYLLIIALVTGAIYALAAFLPDLRFLIWGGGWRVALSVILGTLLGALPALSVVGGGGFEPYNIGRTRLWSADPINFILPSSMHPLWGHFFNTLRPEPYAGEKTLYVGIVALSLALVGLIVYRRGPEARRNRVWLFTALGAAIFALGTDLWINNQALETQHPFWLPAYYLAKLPLINIMRVWSRFGIITIFFVALLAGYGVKALTEILEKKKRGLPTWMLTVGLLVLLLVDILPGWLPTSRLVPRAIDQWLAAQPDDFAVAFFPVDKPLLNDIAIFGSLFHGKQMPSYIHLVHTSRAYKDFSEMALAFPSAESIAYMQRRDFKYLILERAQYNGWRAPEWAEVEEGLAAYPSLSYVTEIDGFVVLRLNAP